MHEEPLERLEFLYHESESFSTIHQFYEGPALDF